eukprot:133332_1
MSTDTESNPNATRIIAEYILNCEVNSDYFNQHMCICGASLLFMDCSNAIELTDDLGSVHCSYCDQYTKTYWVCLDNKAHQLGFSICAKCIDTFSKYDNPEMYQNIRKFIKIDHVFAKYYQQFEDTKYYSDNSDNCGKFLQYVIDKQLDDYAVFEQQLLDETTLTTSPYCKFDPNFPLHHSLETNNVQLKQRIIDRFLRDCLDGLGSIPPLSTLSGPINNSDVDEHKMMSDTDCDSVAVQCNKRHRLIETMKEYTRKSRNKSMDIGALDIKKVLDDYLHVMEDHDAKEFDKVTAAMDTDCNITECKIFARNHRDRNRFRLCDKERHSLYTCDPKQDSCTDDIVRYQLLDTIHCYYMHRINNDNNDPNIPSKPQIAFKPKFNQLSSTNRDATADESRYSFGISFTYNYYNEVINEIESTEVNPSYSSFKEELIQNPIASLSVAQFDSEYTKARHFANSLYCKKHYRTMKVQWILSLVIYCNYDVLQYEFTKTYRDHLDQHGSFYYLARYLKLSVHEFGTKINESRISSFYHGINQKFLFPAYISNVTIYGPLSTTSSFEVATNFTNHNSGLVIEFQGTEFGKAKCFSVAWISDFPSESEYLFIQNEDDLLICNIIDVSLSIEYKVVLRALVIMHEITSKRTWNIETIPPTMQALIVKLLLSQLSDQSLLMIDQDQGSSLQPYGTNLVKTWCDNKSDLILDYAKYTKYYSFLLPIWFDVDEGWIRTDLLSAMFPNIEKIEIKRITLSTEVMDNILCLLLPNTENGWSTLESIEILCQKGADFSVRLAIEQYQEWFDQIGFVLREVSASAPNCSYLSIKSKRLGYLNFGDTLGKEDDLDPDTVDALMNDSELWGYLESELGVTRNTNNNNDTDTVHCAQ